MATTERLRDTLPPLYAGLLPEEFLEVGFSETRAPCSNCVMCAPSAVGERPPPVRFRPDTKCCTYHPKTPNYLIGALLADADETMTEGRRRVRERIGSRIAVTPQWMSPPRKYGILLRAARGSSFGRSTQLLCPFYAGQAGACTIWKFRDSDCSTFFCCYEQGADGQRFWRAVGSFLGFVEAKLAAYAMAAVDPSLREPRLDREMTLEELEDRPPSDADYDRWWGARRGLEEEFYVECFEAVAGLSVSEVVRHVGPAAFRERLDKFLSLERAADDAVVPLRLKRAMDLQVTPKTQQERYVVSYSRYDPVVLSTDVIAALEAFDGALPARDVLDSINTPRVVIDEVTFEALVRWRVLVQADETA